MLEQPSVPTLSPATTTVRDPVCGMEIIRADAAALRQVNGVAYYFCSRDCAVAFDANPAPTWRSKRRTSR